MGFELDAKALPPRVTFPDHVREVAHRLLGKWAGTWCDGDEHAGMCDEITTNLVKEFFPGEPKA